MKTYEGTYRDGSWGVVVHDEDARRTRWLRHVVRHSPDGFSWGYAGSGPSELARCLLIDALGDRVKCRECKGVGTLRMSTPTVGGDAIEYEFRCPVCDGGVTFTGATYHAFKDAFVARWPQEGDWTMTEREIQDWYDAHALTLHGTA